MEILPYTFMFSRILTRKKEPKQMVFLIGCAKSGTSVLSQTIAKHDKVKLFFEDRQRWLSVYPNMDIWSPKAVQRGGKLFFDASDYQIPKAHKLQKVFTKGRLFPIKEPIVLEKLPINTFRLALIAKVFPKAKYIFLFRNPFEVARSMAKKSELGGFYGYKGQKWNFLLDYLKAHDPEMYQLAVQKQDSMYKRGLVEWFASNQLMLEFASSIDPSKYKSLTYNQLINSPTDIFQELGEFLGLDDLDQVVKNEQLIRHSPKLTVPDASTKFELKMAEAFAEIKSHILT